jgi:drug/metabolite transporter (DMT)-like permease
MFLNTTSVVQAIAAAVLFGSSAPIAKLLLGQIEPIPLAAFLYLGSGLGLLLYRSIQRIDKSPDIEARLTKDDLPWLVGAILAGGVAAPIILLFGLRTTPAATASLLLNFEGVATTVIAVIVFREAIGKQVWWSIVLITSASILLTFNPSGGWGISLGAAGVVGACILWGLDNNLTRNISAKDPLEIVTIKGIGAGSFSLLLAFVLHNSFPGPATMLGAMVLGCLSYGLSIVLFILAMRGLGAARTSAFFGTAPFVGSLLSIILFHESPSILFITSLPVMILGAILLLIEKHGHGHLHPSLEHEHRHQHEDEHHNHYHEGEEVLVNSFHSHAHIHETIEHSHPHNPDLHHRHDHQ